MVAGLPAALVVGLLGSGHCLAMCGGIGAALGASSRGRPGLILLFNGGRIASYTLLGALMGALGAGAGQQLSAAPMVLHAIAGLLLRSEEHTSELQSRGHLVCRLLLEK